MNTDIVIVPLAELHPFPGNPFQIREDKELQESIHNYGIISPLVVRPRADGGYEIISGHRRKAACEAAGHDTVPVIVRELDEAAAIIALVDSNLHREHILPSEKAYAYRMKLDAIKHQGVTCGQVVHKSRDTVSDTESGRQVQRYIRLTELIPQIVQMVDDGRIALSPAVELSYLSQQEQTNLLETMESEDRTPSLSQSQRLRRLSADGQLTMDAIFAIMTEDKPNQREKITLKAESIRGYFPKGYTAPQMQEVIIKLLVDWQRKREQRTHGAR